MPSCPMGSIAYVIKPNDTLWKIAQKYNTTAYEIAAENPGLYPNRFYVGRTICIKPKTVPNPEVHFNSRISNKELNLINEMRRLWMEHIFWTRLYIISEASNSRDLDLVTKRLLRNPGDFAALLKPLYGERNSEKFKDLFTDHLVIASQLVKAAKAGNTRAAAEAEKKWYANADEIVEFLNSINPYFSKEFWRKMMHEHLALTKDEAVNILTKNYEAGIEVFDKIERNALAMADDMAKGIVKQFPNIFRTS